MRKIVFVFGILLFAIPSFCEMKRKEVSLTVYNQNFALVRDVREIELKKGVQKVYFEEVASKIDPTSVRISSLNHPEYLVVREQNFEYDLINPDKLLNKYLDRKIDVITKDNYIFKGFLSSFNNSQIIISESKKGKIYMINRENVRNIIFPEIPEGLIVKPTLLWELESKKSLSHLIELMYITSGINWRADYVLEIGEKDDKFDINGWVTIDNKSGATYKNAKLKLIAGEVRRIGEREMRRRWFAEGEFLAKAAPQFKEKPFFEYHLYTLQRPTTVKNNETKQIEFLSATNVKCKKIYVYEDVYYRWWRGKKKTGKVDVYIKFKNSKDNNLGIPLPKGRARLYKKDVDGTSQFIGEDEIDHTPKDEVVKLKIGKAFDIVAEKGIKEHEKIATGVYRDKIEIVLRNHKKEKVKVEVIEHLPGVWEILDKSLPYEKIDAFTIKFIVEIPPDGESKLTYTVQYRY